MELFLPGNFGGERVLYLDLDTAIVGPLDDLMAWNGERAVLSDFYHPKRMASGVLMWRDGIMTGVIEAFTDDPERIVAQYHRRMDHFLRLRLDRAERIQDLYPGQVVSYKADLRGWKKPFRQVEIPEAARIVCMHGKPTLSDLDPDDPVRNAWGS